MLPAADRASPPPPPPAPPPAPTRAAREGGSTTYGASTGPNATPGQRLTAQTTPADRLAPAPRVEAPPTTTPSAGRQLSDDDVRSAATRVVETGERRFWSDDHDARLDAFAREADGLDADSRRRLTAEVIRADSGAVNSWLQGSRLDELAQDGRITSAERTAVVESAAGAYVDGDLSYAQMHTFLGASTDRAPALDPKGFERARDLARGSSPEMSAMREKLVQDAFTQSAERARHGMGFATSDAAWATSLAADAGDSAMVGRSFAALDADAQRAVAGSIGEWSIGYRNSQGEIPGLADPLAVLTSGVRQATPLNTAAGQLNMTRVAEGLAASRDQELQSAAGVAFREVATARDTQRRQDPQALSDGLARVADADARAAKALASLPPNATPEQVWQVYQADPQAIVGSTFTQYLELRGDTARQLQGAALRNDIGLAMGLAPNRAPKDAVEQAAMDRGELDYFAGKELEAVRAIEAKVHDVGGPDARVAALPVTVASEKHGVIQVPLYRVEGADGRARFVDYDPATGEARTYRDFQDWRDNNKLPPGRMTYAANGHLTAGPDGKPQTVTENTPKTPDTAWENWIKPTLDGAALVGSVVLIGAAVVGTGGTALVVGGGLLTAYYGAQGANELIDRGTHGQGVNPVTSAGARGAWIDVGASAVGLAAAGASLRLAAAAGRASSLDDLARLSSAAQQARVLNVGAAAADAGSAANTGYNLAAQWGSLTPQERVAGLAQLAFWSAGTAVSARQVYETKGLRQGIEADRARLEAPGNGPQAIALRQEANAALRNSPAFARDMQQVGVTPRQIELMSSGQLPLGFKDTAQFAQFKAEMDVAMRQAGLPDAEIGLKGTATTFYSENPGKPLGHHWDADPANPGDYDFNVTSPSMVETLRAAGIKPSEKYGVYKTRDLEESFPALDAFQQKWSGILGRDVNFVGYPAAQARDATEYVVRTTP